MRRALTIATAVALATWAVRADAFCGFYVSGAGTDMFNDATQVVLMRLGTRTVLSMQNNYRGPPEAFALVIPVPTVLQEGDVKTLPADVFARVDRMAAPRLVEYWEQDPCAPDVDEVAMMATAKGEEIAEGTAGGAGALGVTIEAKFEVGEYQIVILGAKDAAGLDTWLRAEGYQIPPGAEPYLRPYVEEGMKFFVAKVDPTKVRFDAARRAQLSPLRFHYDAEAFTLPIRLGLANSSGTQDLIIHILAPDQRYDVANYPNVTIPTNLDVKAGVRSRFGEFYAALFDRTLEKHPRAVVTEYAWLASTCDPCPGPQLDGSDFATLGGDVLGGGDAAESASPRHDFVLTRLHIRYGKDVGEDLSFRKAPPIAGGREVEQAGGGLEERAQAAELNNFQARYAIRHPWSGSIGCAAPVRGRWGGPPAGNRPEAVQSALELAFAPRGAFALSELIQRDVPELELKVASASAGGAAQPAPPATAPERKKSGCGCQGAGDGGGWIGAVAVFGGVSRRRRRRSIAKS